MNWETLRADEYCIAVKDGTHDTPKPVDFGYKLVTGKHVKNGQIDSSSAYYISEEDYNAINKRSMVERWDVIMSMIGTVGEAAVVKNDPDYAIKNVALFKCGGSEVRGKWLCYYLNSPEGKGKMLGEMKGSSQQFLSLKQLRELPIMFSEEKVPRIVEIISNYDDLIENNRKQIKLLEEAAQRLYKEWFVDLHFPGHENMKIVDGVPERWNEKTLSQVANVIMGQSPKSEFYNSEKKGLPFHQGVGSYGVRFVMDDIYSTSYTRIAEPNSILFSVRAPVGRLNITKNKVVIGRGLAAINQTDGCQSYLYYLLKNKFFKDNIVGNGSIFASVSKDELLNQKFLIPERNLMMQFEKIVSQMDKQIENLDSKNKKLIEARDRLLPELMSGEMEV